MKGWWEDLPRALVQWALRTSSHEQKSKRVGVADAVVPGYDHHDIELQDDT